MSIVGNASSASVNLIASFAGTLRNSADADRILANQAAQKSHADIVRISEPDLTDDLETDTSHGQVADRDADGRLPWTFRGPPAPLEDEPADDTVNETNNATDQFEERGGALDLNA